MHLYADMLGYGNVSQPLKRKNAIYIYHMNKNKIVNKKKIKENHPLVNFNLICGLLYYPQLHQLLHEKPFLGDYGK